MYFLLTLAIILAVAIVCFLVFGKSNSGPAANLIPSVSPLKPLNSTPEPTLPPISQWQSYRNDKPGQSFEIKYPPPYQFIVTTSSASDEFSGNIQRHLDTPDSPADGVFIQITIKSLNGASLQNYVQKIKSDNETASAGSAAGVVFEISSSSFAGQPSLILTATETSVVRNIDKTYYIEKEGRVYALYYSYESGYIDETVAGSENLDPQQIFRFNTIKAILDTFKLTEPSADAVQQQAERTVIDALVSSWPQLQSKLGGKPANGQWFLDDIQFISQNTFLISYEDGHFLSFAIIKTADQKFSVLKTYPTRSVFSYEEWQNIVKSYGSAGYSPHTYTKGIVRGTNIVTFPDYTLITENTFSK